MQFVLSNWRYPHMQKILPALAFFLVCCKEVDVPKPQINFKDSLINEYLIQVDSLEFYDTTNYDFKILKAYSKNDKAFFQQMQKDIDYEREHGILNSALDSCVQLKKLSDLDVDEAYRFKHSESFCFYNQFVTIDRKAEKYLSSLFRSEFGPGWEGYRIS